MWQKLRRIFCFAFVCCNAFHHPIKSQAQSPTRVPPPKPYFEQVVPDERFNGRNINALLQDQKGFMWFATTWGLVRFDGYEAIAYQHDARDTSTISGDHVLSLYLDNDGAIWAGTNRNGLNRLDRATGTFRRFRKDSDKPPSLSDNHVRAIYRDRSGFLWVGTAGGLDRLGKDSNEFTHFLGEESNSANVVAAILEDQRGRLWVGSQQGLLRFDENRQPDTAYVHCPEDVGSLSDNQVISLLEDDDGRLWAGTLDGGLNLFDESAHRFDRFQHLPAHSTSISNNTVRSIFEDRHRNLWIGTEGGINLLNRTTGHFIRYQQDSDKPGSINSNFVTSIFEDNSGTLWVGTGGLFNRGNRGHYGIVKWDPGKRPFDQFSSDPVHLPELGEKQARVAYEDRNGYIWIGTKTKGLIRVDRSNGAYRQFLHNPANPQSLSHSAVHSILEDNSGIFWVGTSNGGLNRFNPKNGQWMRFSHIAGDSSSLNNNRVIVIHEDRAGRLWLGNGLRGGLHLFDRKNKKFKRFLHDPSNLNSLSNNTITDIVEDESSVLWISTYGGGINRFDPVTNNFTRFNQISTDTASLSNATVWDLYLDPGGMLWVATAAGLNRFDPATGSFTVFTEKDGLSNNAVFSIQGDDRNRLWIATNNGLTLFDPPDQSFRRFNKENGLHQSSYVFGKPGKTNDGFLFLCGDGGIDVFHPDSIIKNAFIPPIVFTRLTRYTTEKDGRSIVRENVHISEVGEIAFSFGQQTLSFVFAALNFRHSEKNQYAYRLENAMDSRVYLDERRTVSFTNLAPGNYTLHIQGSNDDGIWNEQGATIRLTILPPWYRTWWAYSLYTLLAIAMFWVARRYELTRQQLKHDLQMQQLQIEREQQKAEELKELDRLKSRFFANVSHEFRTPLTLIVGPLKQLLKDDRSDKNRPTYTRMLNSGRRLQLLIDQLLDLSKLEAGKMSLNPVVVNLRQMIRLIFSAFESLATMRKIDFVLEEENFAGKILADRDKIEKIVSNLISNALKFTPDGGRVVVSYQLKDNCKEKFLCDKLLEVAVQDTGIGIAQEQQKHIFDRFYQANSSSTRKYSGTGIGLSLTKELVNLHLGEIRVHSITNRGSTFTVRLPVQTAPPGATGHKNARRATKSLDLIIARDLPTAQSKPLEAATNNSSSGSAAMLAERPYILLVEDNNDMRIYLRETLQNSYRIFEAAHGKEGLKKAQQLSPALIISDVMMPEMDGFQFCSKLKTDARTSHIPVILLTARASPDSKIQGLETGADDYLTKPFDPNELLTRVENLIQLRKRLRERFRHELTIEPAAVTMSSLDSVFLEKAVNAVMNNISDASLDISRLARLTGVSTRHLSRKLRELTGQTAREFIRTIRLKRAASILQQDAATITEVAYQVGLPNLSNFIKIFREMFTVTPAKYRRQFRNKESGA